MLKISIYIAGAILLSLHATSNITAENEKDTPQSPEAVCPVIPGTQFPNTNVKNVEGDSFSITQSVADQPAIIIFYRGGWCPYCNMHLQELRTIEDELLGMGYNIFAVSPDTPEKLTESLETQDMQYTLLSDSDLQLGRSLGIVFQEKEENVEWLREHDMDIEEYSGREHHMLPVPAVFIVDTEGIIRFTFVHPDYRIRLDSDVLLTAAESLLDSNWELQR